MPQTKKKILIISHDHIGSTMAGPGIRYHYMAELLSKDFDVTVGFFDSSYLPDEDFKTTYKTQVVNNIDFRAHFEPFNVVIALWLSKTMLDFCQDKNIFVVIDMYAPVPVENLALFLYSGKPLSSDVDYEYRQSFAMYEDFFRLADLFLVSNQRQLDFWAGYAFGTDQILVSSYEKRPFFDRLLYAPMGIDSSQKLEHSKNVMRGVIPGINKTDKILLWTGGIWNWYDAQTLVRAMDVVRKKRPDVKLVFFGTKHPNPNVPEMREATKALRLATDLNLLGTSIFMQDGWVPYSERINYLLEADIAINTSKPSIEAEFSHRTRVLDHLLAELPTIATEGDYLTDDVIAKHSLGISVPPNNEKAIADAIIALLDTDLYEETIKNIRSVRASFDWTKTLLPLQRALKEDMPKLEYVSVKKRKSIPNNALARNVKKFIPVPIKRAIVRALKYGQ